MEKVCPRPKGDRSQTQGTYVPDRQPVGLGHKETKNTPLFIQEYNYAIKQNL